MDTLTAAKQKATDISVALATMKRPSEIIPAVDELLEILTGQKVFRDVPHFQRNPTPISPATVILSYLKIRKSPTTLRRICRETGLDPSIAQSAIDEILAQDKITSPKKRGHRQYVCVEHAIRL